MLAQATVSVCSKRALHVSTRNYDFLSWFKNKQNAKNKEPAKDTKQVIEDIESGRSKTRQSANRLKLTEDSFIGQELQVSDRARRGDLLQQVPFNIWLSSQKVRTSEALDRILLDTYVSTVPESTISKIEDPELALPFSDLSVKFQFTKSLQATTGIMVPDYQSTRLQTPLQFREFFLKEVLSGKAKFNDAEPNAIDIDESFYGAESIHVVKTPAPKDQRQKLSKILSEVEALEKEAARQALETARRVV
ncbi:LADA_0G11496g1_1 [Lachancea dasiensis]|uniref:Large ribosomal subunit protein mL50 n=1 Tax=Lachancea dasiensis TaxID=1072105 RepID=A0A1G4JUZ2_9SACH|nr:LADA_0G11496g1_1 [Lachancea dasiensis]